MARDAWRGLGEPLTTAPTWDDLAHPPAVMAALREIVDRGAQARPGGGCALFAGPSGAGKTTAAAAVGRTLGVDVVRVDLASVVSKYIGETEKNLKRLFDAAEAANAVLVFDEAEALFGRRSEVKDAHDRYANLEVASLLQRIEGYAGLVILTTSTRDNIDPAFLRRLRWVVAFAAREGA